MFSAFKEQNCCSTPFMFDNISDPNVSFTQHFVLGYVLETQSECGRCFLALIVLLGFLKECIECYLT